MKRFTLIIALASLTLAFTGCDQNAKNRPSDTILGSTHSERPDWIDDDEVYREEGLALRPTATYRGTDVTAYASKAPASSVYFGFDKAGVKESERGKLSEMLEVLKNDPYAGLLVVGHCDWYGTHEYNLALGDRRAKSVLTYLDGLGLDSSRIRVLSKGSLDAKEKGRPDVCWHDRRADIIVMR